MLTIGFGRRFATYKRGALVFREPGKEVDRERFYDFVFQPLPAEGGTAGIAVVVFEVTEVMAAKRAAEVVK